MTREEFLDTIDNIDDLISFCYDNDMEEYCSSVHSRDSVDEYLCDLIQEKCRHESWESVREMLNDIEPGYDWYVEDDCYIFAPLEDYVFCDIREEVLDHCEDIGYFDNPEDEEEDFLSDLEEETTEACEPDDSSSTICFDDFLSSNNQVLQTVQEYIASRNNTPSHAAEEDELYDEPLFVF